MTPQELRRTATAAERVIRELEDGERHDARENAQRLDAAVHESDATARLKVQTGTLAGLAARDAPGLAVAQAANRVRDLVAVETERDGDTAAGALLRLDYLEREVELRSMAGQRAAAQAAARAALGIWTKNRVPVVAAAGEGLADRFGRHLARLQAHEGPIHIQAEARDGLELLAKMRRRGAGAL